MNQKKARKEKQKAAEKKADKYYEEFLEMLQQAYGVRKHGYMWETKAGGDEREDEPDELDNTIIQSSLCESIVSICNAAMCLLDYGSPKRTQYFKAAVIYCETLKGYEHVFTMSLLALKRSTDKRYFQNKMKQYYMHENKNQEVNFDVEELLNRLDEVTV